MSRDLPPIPPPLPDDYHPGQRTSLRAEAMALVLTALATEALMLAMDLTRKRGPNE